MSPVSATIIDMVLTSTNSSGNPPSSEVLIVASIPSGMLPGPTVASLIAASPFQRRSLMSEVSGLSVIRVRPMLSTRCRCLSVRSSFFISTVTERMSTGAENWNTPEAMGIVRLPTLRKREGVGCVQRDAVPEEEALDADVTDENEDDEKDDEGSSSSEEGGSPRSIALYSSS